MLGQLSFQAARILKFKQLFELTSIFFVRTVLINLIQDPADKINYLHFAMASCRILMVLVRIYLYERGVATRIQGAGQSAMRDAHWQP